MTTYSGAADVPMLPDGAHLIHVGPPKTGSTLIQHAMLEVRDQLAEYGVHYAGKYHRPRFAGWAIGLEGKAAGLPVPEIRFWNNLVKNVADAGDARVMISNEDFGRATAEQARRIVDELGGERPHVVAVARRLDKFLPSQWQERVKASKPTGYDEYLRSVLTRPEDPYNWDRTDPGFSWERSDAFYAHEPDTFLKVWVDIVGPENVTVAVGGDDRTLIPNTIERLLGLPLGLLPMGGLANESLDWSVTEMVEAFNERLARRPLENGDRRLLVSKGLVNALAEAPRQSVGARVPPLPAWALETVRERAARRVLEYRALGVNVVGDLDLLAVPDDSVTAEELDPPLVDPKAAAVAIDWALGMYLESRAEVEELRAQVQAQPTETAAPVPGGAQALLGKGRRVAGRALRRARRVLSR